MDILRAAATFSTKSAFPWGMALIVGFAIMAPALTGKLATMLLPALLLSLPATNRNGIKLIAAECVVLVAVTMPLILAAHVSGAETAAGLFLDALAVVTLLLLFAPLARAIWGLATAVRDVVKAKGRRRRPDHVL